MRIGWICCRIYLCVSCNLDVSRVNELVDVFTTIKTVNLLISSLVPNFVLFSSQFEFVD